MMKNRSLIRIGAILGIGIVVVSGTLLMLTSAEREPVAAALATAPLTPSTEDTAVQVTQSATATPTLAPTAPPTPVPPAETSASAPDPALLEVAPDFTLQGAKGASVTLSEQLTQGPVVLVFFTRTGG